MAEDGCDDDGHQGMSLESFQTFGFRISTFVLRSDLVDVAINELMKDDAQKGRADWLKVIA
ncbi:hypothetical protein JFU47_32695 [Pseudomonas sp. TH39(2020)]|uniref:hypothetical protein n=1 Tax=Pseudomonas sp. TH39(2020) TaxID=2796349 RepID=UPI0019148303|nr:hypothetical protein [Pseudomonas sp. TH39(2020)]MBK5401436.1 hypothetical protein [Pseudomonas sp. TH39(2020)]